MADSEAGGQVIYFPLHNPVLCNPSSHSSILYPEGKDFLFQGECSKVTSTLSA